MAEQAAHLVDAVLPWAPVRQWVLTVPHRLRYRLAFDHALCRAVLGAFVRAVLGWYRHRARRAGSPACRSARPLPRHPLLPRAGGGALTPPSLQKAKNPGERPSSDITSPLAQKAR